MKRLRSCWFVAMLPSVLTLAAADELETPSELIGQCFGLA